MSKKNVKDRVFMIHASEDELEFTCQVQSGEDLTELLYAAVSMEHDNGYAICVAMLRAALKHLGEGYLQTEIDRLKNNPKQHD